MSTWLPKAIEHVKEVVLHVNGLWRQFDAWYQGLTSEGKAKYKEDVRLVCSLFAECVRFVFLFMPKDATDSDDKINTFKGIVEKLAKAVREMMDE